VTVVFDGLRFISRSAYNTRVRPCKNIIRTKGGQRGLSFMGERSASRATVVQLQPIAAGLLNTSCQPVAVWGA
jgi:hypothetical protein